MGIAINDKGAGLEGTGDWDAVAWEGVGGAGLLVAIMLQAAALTFIDADSVGNPYVDKPGVRVENGIPCLLDGSFIPLGHGCVKACQVARAKSQAEKFAPCGPDGWGGHLLVGGVEDGRTWVEISLHCPFTDVFTITRADVGKCGDAKVESAALGIH